MSTPPAVDWFELRVSLQTLLRLTNNLRLMNLKLREELPPGEFHHETDEPLDLLGEIEAFTHLIESEYLDDLAGCIREMTLQLNEDVCHPVAH